MATAVEKPGRCQCNQVTRVNIAVVALGASRCLLTRPLPTAARQASVTCLPNALPQPEPAEASTRPGWETK